MTSTGMYVSRVTKPERARMGKGVIHPPAKPLASPRYRDRLATATDWQDATSRRDVTVMMPDGTTFVVPPECQPTGRRSRGDHETTGNRTTTAGAQRERMHGVTLAEVQRAILTGQPIKGY